MSSVASPEFGRLRALFWPIHRKELRLFLPLLLIYALIVFNYSLLKAAKDALVVTAPASGAEAIPFIKFWAIFPMALFMTFVFTRLSNRFNREQVFYLMMSVFLGFFLLFAIVLYPFRDALHPNGLADKIQETLPLGFRGMISIFRNWTFTLFYVMSELWGTTIMTVLFWGFANEVFNVKDAKRFYAILGIGANLSSVVSGKVSISLSRKIVNLKILPGVDRWGQVIVIMTGIVVIAGLITMIVYRWLNKQYEKTPPSGFAKNSPKQKIKMGLRKNFAYLAKSKYLMRIAILVLAFNVVLNMIEIAWKDQVRLLFPDPTDFNAYMGKVMIAIGITSTIVAVFLCGNVIRIFGWTFTALITPTILLVTGILFFSFLLFKDTKLASLATLMGSTPLALGVFFGSMQNCLSRASKFTFFDTTKEMAFIPLSQECKLKGKAAIDGVGSRLGKSGGSLFYQMLIVVFGSVSAITPFVAIILFGVASGWIVAAKSLGRKFDKLTATHETIDIDKNEDTPRPDSVFPTKKQPEELLTKT